MIAVFRAPDKKTGKLAPLVVIAISAYQVILTDDTNMPTPAVGLDPTQAREVAARLVALANEIDDESRW